MHSQGSATLHPGLFSTAPSGSKHTRGDFHKVSRLAEPEGQVSRVENYPSCGPPGRPGSSACTPRVPLHSTLGYSRRHPPVAKIRAVIFIKFRGSQSLKDKSAGSKITL